jgi:RNA-binding protein PNO1
MNTKRKCVELKTSTYTEDKASVQKGADFLKAFMLGFDLNDAIAMLRLDDLYIESFEIKDGRNNDDVVMVVINSSLFLSDSQSTSW